MRFNYLPPVSKVVTYGVIKPRKQPSPEHWPDYVGELGLRSEHVPELIRLALDRECQKVPCQWVEVYGQVHGWRALGQLKATEAAEPLLSLLGNEGDDWVTDEIPYVYGMIGGAAIPALAGADQSPVMRGDCASFQTMACSRPPLPMTRTFMWRQIKQENDGAGKRKIIFLHFLFVQIGLRLVANV